LIYSVSTETLNILTVNTKWDVPWSGATVIGGIVSWSTSFVLMAALIVPFFVSEVLGLDRNTFDIEQQAEYLLLVQVVETIISLTIVYACVFKYKDDDAFTNEKNDWFKIDFSDPVDREKNGWLLYGLAGYFFTFIVVAMTGFAIDSTYEIIKTFQENSSSGSFSIDSSSSSSSSSSINLDPSEAINAIAATKTTAAKAQEVGTIDGVLPLIKSGDPVAIVSLLAVTSVFAPLLEEVVFRGFLLTSLTKWLPAPGAVLFSSVIFGLVHFAPRDFPELVALGCVLGFSYVRTRNLLVPMFIHSLWNSGVLVLLLVAIQIGVADELGIPGF
jgi:membrane protease YdiL (CAAX protease family)